MKVAELFAGCGGMALGFEKAGLQTTALFEIDKTACATLKKIGRNGLYSMQMSKK